MFKFKVSPFYMTTRVKTPKSRRYGLKSRGNETVTTYMINEKEPLSKTFRPKKQSIYRPVFNAI